jgi:hypothetical protein
MGEQGTCFDGITRKTTFDLEDHLPQLKDTSCNKARNMAVKCG